MSELIKEFVARKAAWRVAQYRLPMSEKARIVERLRDRTVAFQHARSLRFRR